VAAALVLTIFNPRAETNGYVLISPLLAYAAVNDWRQGAGNKWKGMVLAAACIGLMCDGMGLWIYKATDVWFKPMIVLLVSPLLFRMPEGWKGKG
jgi:ABC-type Mn2+/Zn2+ transport system permease subunit